MINLSAILHMFSDYSFIILFLQVHSLPLWLLTNVEILSLFPAIIVIGGLILLTLSYVSWRKYKGEVKERKKDKSVD